MNYSRSLTLCAALAVTSAGAFASDGSIEINHACAAGPGCFSGDAAAYPVQIDGSAGSHYLLTSDLVVPDADTDGILVGAPGINIDLNGFQISNSACIAAPGVDCRPESGTGTGVGLDPKNGGSASPGGLRNGTIMGMGANGAELASGITVENIAALWNGADGIVIASGAVRNCQAIQNGQNGIRTTSLATITENIANFNVVRGIDAETSSIIRENQTWANTDDGVRAASGSTLEGNSSGTNGGDGFEIGLASFVRNNTAASNTNFGFRFDGNSPYSDNAAQMNAEGGVSGGVNRGGNYCEGDNVSSADCP